MVPVTQAESFLISVAFAQLSFACANNTCTKLKRSNKKRAKLLMAGFMMIGFSDNVVLGYPENRTNTYSL